MSKYLTYAEYIDLGGALNEQEFLPLELKGRKRIDYLTANRVQAMSSVPEAVKLCVYALIGLEQTAGLETAVTSPQVTGFKNDGYSETYANTPTLGEIGTMLNKTAVEYLYGEHDDNGTPLLYRGLDR